MANRRDSPVRLTIDLDAIAANWRLLRSRAEPAECAAVVKADAYGLGASVVVSVLVEAGCRTFFVATVDEGVAVRAVAPEAVVPVLDGFLPSNEHAFLDHRLIPVVNSLDQLGHWNAVARKTRTRLKTILQLDSGMTRLGLGAPDLQHLATHPELLDLLDLTLLMSHLACADTPDHPQNARQLAAFRAMCSQLPRGIPRSLAASSGLFLGEEYRFDLVRPGVALYGVNPVPGRPNPMLPVVRLDARILQLRDVPGGQSVGYGATYSVGGPSRIATVGIGYADGWMRSLGNRGHAVVGEHLVPIVGRVSMDLTTLDVTDVPRGSVQEGDWATLIGPSQPIDSVAEQAGTIGYEILTQLSRRATREYVRSSPRGDAR